MNKLAITSPKIDLQVTVKNKLSKSSLDSKNNQQTITKKREYGFAKGKIKLSPDFDAPIVLVNQD